MVRLTVNEDDDHLCKTLLLSYRCGMGAIGTTEITRVGILSTLPT